MHKYNCLLQILLKLMDTSHDFIATKTCPSCAFFVVFGQLRVQDRKSAVRVRVGMVCWAGVGWKCAGAGLERVRFLKFLRVRGGFKFCGCGAGADKKLQPAQDSAFAAEGSTRHC